MAESFAAIYIHIPFCERKCLYCDFFSLAGCGPALKRSYVKALCKEIELAARAEDAFALPVKEGATVYFGGGTPSVLDTEDIKTIVATLKKAGLWRRPREATVEVNPGTADERKLGELRRLGLDRLSVGVQSLQDEELRALGRIHSAAEALETLKAAKKAGFERISADVMYGIPLQNRSSLKKTLGNLAATAATHLSVYGLTLEEGTPLARSAAAKKAALPEEEETEEMYFSVQDFMKAAGFSRYEISNYARPGQESLHNQIYWRYRPYLGLGAGACGFNGSCRRTGLTELSSYINMLKDATALPFALHSYEELSVPVQTEEFLMLGLRQTRGADLKEAEERFGKNIEKDYAAVIARFVKEGLLTYRAEERRLALTEKGMAVGNRVFAAFML